MTAAAPETTSSETAVHARSSASPIRTCLYACSSTRKRTHHAERHSLDRRFARRPAPRVRRDIRRPHRARHRCRRVHGVASHGRPRRPRRIRPRLRARKLERRSQQHLPPSRPADGSLRGSHRSNLGRHRRPRPQDQAGSPVRLPSRRAGARRRVMAPALRDDLGERRRNTQFAAVDRRLRISTSRSSTPPARPRSTGTSTRTSPTTTTSTMRAASSSTNGRRSTRSRSTRPRRSRPTS